MTRHPLHRLPPLNALRAFEMAGRKGSFRAAADELHITQGAVAQQVRGLEERLGIALFRRLPRGLALTPAGAAYLNDVSRAFGILASATAKLQKRPDTVTISVTPTVATRLLIPRLADLQAALPGLELRTLATEALSDFEHDQVDMAVRLTRPPFPPQLEAVPLFPQELIAVASPHLLRHLTCPLSPDELQTLPLLHDAHNHWPAFLQALPPCQDTPAASTLLPGPTFNQTSLALDAALAAQGIAIACRAFVADDLAAGRLVQVSTVTLRLPAGYFLVRPRSTPSPAAQAVWNWCLAHLGVPAERSAG